MVCPTSDLVRARNPSRPFAAIIAAMQEADAQASRQGVAAGERMRAHTDALCTFAVAERGVARPLFGHDASSSVISARCTPPAGCGNSG